MPLNIIFMGTPEFAVPALAALLQSGHHVVAVYTQPPRPAGRGQKERLSPVHAYALEHGLSVRTPATLRNEEAQQQFRALHADAALVAAYGLLLPRPILDGTRLGCINIHPSLLPRWRGAAPIQRTVMAGDTQTGVVIMKMDAGLDTGDMLLVKHYPISDGTNAGTLHDTLSQMAAPMAVDVLEKLNAGSITPVKQPEAGVIYAKKIVKEECRIDWNEPAGVLRSKILGLSPAPGAYCIYLGEAIKILNAEILPAASGSPGITLDDSLRIACGKDSLRPLLLQRPGKKPVSSQEFLRGYPIPRGTQLE